MKHSLQKWVGATLITMVAATAQADQFYLDVGGNFDAFGTKVAGPNTTGSFDEMNIRYNSTSIITDANTDGLFSPGDTVLGSGGLLKLAGPAGLSNSDIFNRVTTFTPSATFANPLGPALNGYGAPNWLMSFGWTNLVGTVNATGGIDYTSGLIHISMTDPSIFGDGAFYDIALLNVTSGGTNTIGQSLNLTGTVTVLPGVAQNVLNWTSDNSSWFNSPVTITFESNQNTQPFYVNGTQVAAIDPTTFYGPNGTFGYLEGEHDGSLSFNRVPEPGSMALLGTALLGLGVLRRRKSA